MYKFRGFFLAASAVLLLAGGAAALDPQLLALNTPVKAGLKIDASKKAARSSAQARQDYIDFDAVSATDPLYREGAKEMLREAVKQDGAVKPEEKPAQAKPALRDAPISRDTKAVKPAEAKPAKALKNPRSKKPVHSDPVKANAL